MSLVTVCAAAAVCALVCAALPAPPAPPAPLAPPAPPAPPPATPRYFAQATNLRQINPLDYYLDSPEIINYYTAAQQRQAGAKAAPARLETLEPDSEVELIPGAQPPPPPPPPQTPVSPQLPGLLPGQRVFIVHMPVPGYRPGTIAGYQPVYIVAAAPPGSYATGLPSAVLVEPPRRVASAAGWPPGYGLPAARLAQLTALHAQPPAHRTEGTASSSKVQAEEYESNETKETAAEARAPPPRPLSAPSEPRVQDSSFSLTL